jgi:hypothetical protein
MIKSSDQIVTEKKYTLKQRIKSKKPTFFKRAQFLGLGLTALGTELLHEGYVPEKYCMIIMAVGSTLAILSQFAVKQTVPGAGI